MRILKNTLASAAVASLLVAQPLLAAPALDRSGSAVAESEELAGASSGLIIAGSFVLLLVLAELIGVIDVFGDDDDNPTSP